MQWEYPGLSDCGPGAYACWESNMHYAHDNHDHVSQSFILFDAAYSALAWEWQSRIAAHEWGHAFSLRDHSDSSDPCYPLIMNYASISGPACVLNPSFSEVCSSWTAYGYRDDYDDVFVPDGCDVRRR